MFEEKPAANKVLTQEAEYEGMPHFSDFIVKGHREK